MRKSLYLVILLAALFVLPAFSFSPGDPLGEELTAQAAVLMDYATGRVLYDRAGDEPIPPASMTKVMTLYLAYEALEEGVLRKEQVITIDEAGSSFSRPPRSSLMLLEEGQEVTVLDLMKGLAVASGNDAAYALADLIGPGTDAFIEKMNAKAREMGLNHTVFVDPDGWSEFNQVTAREFSRLARTYIAEYPEALEELHSVPFMIYPMPENMPEERTFRIQAPRKKKNTNWLLKSYPGIDGLKTGYIDEAGFNFSATAAREEGRLISVIMGIHTDSYYQGLQRRAEETEILLDYGFDSYAYRPLDPPELPEMRVWKGSEQELIPVQRDVPGALLTEGEETNIYAIVELTDRVIAPVAPDDVIGRVTYYLEGNRMGETDLIAGREIPEGNLFQRAFDGFLIWLEDLRG